MYQLWERGHNQRTCLKRQSEQQLEDAAQTDVRRKLHVIFSHFFLVYTLW